MGADDKVLLRVTPEGAKWLEAKGIDADEGSWLQVNGAGDPDALALEWKTTLVEWSIQTTSDVVMISAHVGGKEVRSLTYVPDDGWSTTGKPQPFEDTKELGRWLKRKRVLASPDGYDVLAAFLGAQWDEGTTLAHAPVPAAPVWVPERTVLDEIDDAWFDERWPDLIRLLKKKGMKKEAAAKLIWATSDGNLSLMKRFLAAKFDPNQKDDAGRLPLLAARTRETIAVLVKGKAKVDAKNGAGETALVAAVTNLNPQSAECVKALLAAGANPKQRHDGKSLATLAKDFARRHKPAKAWADEVVQMLEAALQKK